jgi:hypothetical protein
MHDHKSESGVPEKTKPETIAEDAKISFPEWSEVIKLQGWDENLIFRDDWRSCGFEELPRI